jgi:hypothetical protein
MADITQEDQKLIAAADVKLDAAVTAQRSLLFYTTTATLPIIMIAVVLLFTKLHGRTLMVLSLIGAITGFIGLGRLLYEMTLDIAGYPDYKLPIWSVFYLIVYLISAFGFLFFALHTAEPGRYFGGFDTNPKAAYLDAVYISLSDYIGTAPDPVFSLKNQFVRFLAVGQGILSLFINVVIITKFVNSF